MNAEQVDSPNPDVESDGDGGSPPRPLGLEIFPNISLTKDDDAAKVARSLMLTDGLPALIAMGDWRWRQATISLATTEGFCG